MKLLDRLAEWWRGKWVPMTVEEYDRFASIDGGYRVRPLLARLLIPAGKFYLANWKWLIPLIITTTFSLMKLFSDR